ncbi:MAG: hypothetical protein ABID38_00300 [Candidatus Diapherotrites archaeon]
MMYLAGPKKSKPKINWPKGITPPAGGGVSFGRKNPRLRLRGKKKLPFP